MGIGNSSSLVAEELAAGMSGVARITTPLGYGSDAPPERGRWPLGRPARTEQCAEALQRRVNSQHGHSP